MELNDVLAIIAAIGGVETVKWIINFYVNRKTDARKEKASAESMEGDNERKQISWLEERIAQRDAKIDSIYVELRKEQSEKIEWIHKCHDLELGLKDADYNRCNIPDSDCGRRIPPRKKYKTAPGGFPENK